MKRCKLALRNPVSASPAAGVPVLLRRQRTFSAVSPSPTHSLSLSQRSEFDFFDGKNAQIGTLPIEIQRKVV